MRLAEDKERGLLAIQVEDQVFRFARAVYDGGLLCYKPQSVIPISQFRTFPTKALASEEARRLSWPQRNVQRIGNRFGVAWGLKLGPLHDYFLADYS